MRRWIAVGLLMLAPAMAAAQETPRARKIVLIAGPLDSHPRNTHEYEKNVFLLKHCLDTAPNIKGVRTEVHLGGWPADEKTLDDADTIVMTSGGCDRRLEDHPLYVGKRLETLERQMKRGCGVLFFHWSTFHPAQHHERITEWAGGYFDYETGPAPRKWYSAIETKEWTTALGDAGHPILRGVRPFRVKEEFYFKIRFREDDPRLKPILLKQADGDARANTVGWAVQRADGGRGFGFTGGHFTANWWIPEFRRMVLNAVLWTARAEVPEGGVESELGPPLKALILTGYHYPAHDWPTTSAALLHALEQDPRITVDVTENIEDLATPKIDGYDLLVMNYMNWDRPGLSDAAKANFTRALSDGKGLLVFHGATGAFNRTLGNKDADWEEYRTKIVRRSWLQPTSGHDEFGGFKVRVLPGPHPVTAGLADFETRDELYVRLAGELPAEPLVVAHSKVTGKEEPLAWGYEYGKGRVFLTALGHADVSVRTAAPLFRRGAVWAAGRPPLAFDPPAAALEKATFRPGSPWTPKPKREPKPPQEQKPSSKVVPSDTGFKGGHWGTEGEKDWVDGRWSQTDVGPFMTSALKVGGGTLVRAISIKVGEKGEGGVVFDPDTLSLRAGWTGKFLAFSPARYGLIEMPKIAGDLRWTAPPGTKGRYRGLHLDGPRVILSYEIDSAEVLESPWLETADALSVFTRTFEIGPCPKPITLLLAREEGTVAAWDSIPGGIVGRLQKGKTTTAAALLATTGASLVPSSSDQILLRAGAPDQAVRVKAFLWSGLRDDVAKFRAHVQAGRAPEDLPERTRAGGAPRWTPLVTKGHVSKEKGPYVIDTLTVPYDNPWKALMFMGGLDFFENGDAAVCSIHGDVWRVSGIDETLEKLTWRRYATGLYQALGLRIVKGQVYVLGRDRITRLHDRNGDGEADFYESFTADLPTSAGGHDYITCLETDAAGNFYFASWKGVFRISADGTKTELVATGFRNPNGLSVGPDGTVTAAPQEGEWTPASMICQVKAGAHYGYGGPRNGIEPPLVYLPRLMDNSTGGQVWVTSDRWGPFQGQLFNLSFGRSTMQLVLRETLDGCSQGAAVPTGLLFASGAMRGRFHPKDGQLYVAGSKGWVSTAVRDGCLQRVRHTGAPSTWALAWSSHADGIRLSFAVPLDREIAQDLDRWAADQWNYRYSEKYGSEDYSVASPQSVGHDVVEIRAAGLSADGRSVFLEIPNLKPVHQLRVRYNLRSAEGTPVKGEAVGTLHRLGPPAR